MTILLDSVALGDVVLGNRLIMAPTPCVQPIRGRVPGCTVGTYYARRASAGLIITEATSVSPLGVSLPDAPGIWNSTQVRGWRLVTDAVHEKGGRIFLRLWHAGRVSDPEYLCGEMPVAPSAIACANPAQYVVPRSLHPGEIRRIVADFDQAARHARQAGFDGIQIHAGDGYLIDQFLHDGSNQRGDAYGGSIPNRCRFLIEVVDACIGVWGSGRVGLHLSPRGDRHDMHDSDPAALFRYIAREMNTRQLAFICAREHPGPDALTPVMRDVFDGGLILNEGYDLASAHTAIEAGCGEAVAFGKAFVTNPDLVERLRSGEALRPLPLAPADSVREASTYAG